MKTPHTPALTVLTVLVTLAGQRFVLKGEACGRSGETEAGRLRLNVQSRCDDGLKMYCEIRGGSADTPLVLLHGVLGTPEGGSAAASAVRIVTSRDGTRIAFEQSGAGPALILVAGALSSRSSGTRLAALLAPHFTVINYDRRGRGDSGDTPPYSVQREVEDIEALIDHAGGSAFVFGSSSGAALALEAARRLPAKVSKAALFEPPFVVDDSRPRVPEDFAQHLAELVSAGRRGDAVEYFMIKGVGVPPEMITEMRAAPMWPGLEKLAHTLPYDGAVMGDTLAGKPLPAERWAAVTAPVLVMDGQQSEAWLRTSAQALAGVLPHAQHRTLEGQDHSAAFRAPEAFVPVLVEFFGG